MAWELAKHGYAAFSALAFRSSPVYAALGALPLFLMWIYVSWMIVLLGARVAYTVQHVSYRGVLLALERHPRARELVAARVAQLITRAFLEGTPPPTPRRIARQLSLPDATTRETLGLLSDAGLVRKAGLGVVPARAPEELTVGDISLAVGGLASLGTGGAEPSSPLEALFESADASTLAHLSGMSWTALARDARNP